MQCLLSKRCILQESEGGVAAAAWKKIWSSHSLYKVEDQESMIDEMMNGAPYVLVGDHTEMMTLGMGNGACNWGMMSETFLPVGFGIAFQKGAPFMDEFDRMYTAKREMG